MIRVENLSKSYGRVVAVSNVTFSAEPGTVTGFLGPNGAGKSTTLRMLAGLTRPTSGTATIAGRAYRDLPNPGRVVGVMLDASAQHAGRTGRETLRLAAGLLGVSNRRADELLEQVGLAGAAGRRVANYSLGMRQRLGIAQALLGDPAALVLDEPVNGLDPEGIRWTRNLLRDFAARGGTVLLSSHMLSEVEATVDRLVVIGGGQVVAEGPLAELQGSRGTVARSLDPVGLTAVLRAAGIAVRPAEDGAVVADADVETVGRHAAAAGLVLIELRPETGASLEQLFFDLTSDPAARPAA
jgi:ABC-2 type transport system ATP-binding protein